MFSMQTCTELEHEHSPLSIIANKRNPSDCSRLLVLNKVSKREMFQNRIQKFGKKTFCDKKVNSCTLLVEEFIGHFNWISMIIWRCGGRQKKNLRQSFNVNIIIG